MLYNRETSRLRLQKKDTFEITEVISRDNSQVTNQTPVALFISIFNTFGDARHFNAIAHTGISLDSSVGTYIILNNRNDLQTDKLNDEF